MDIIVTTPKSQMANAALSGSQASGEPAPAEGGKQS
jgi:hypothetical protein